MKKIIAILLALAMAFCVCGCRGNGDNTSTLSDDVEYEHIKVYYDENGNEIKNPYSDKTSNNTSENNSTVSNNNSTNTSGNANTNTSTNNQAAAIDYNTVVEVDICDDIIRGYLSATSVDQQYYFLNEYTGSQLDYQNLHLDWNLDGSSIYTVYISENADFSNAYTIETKSITFKEGICVPGKTYYWKVMGTNSSEPLAGGKIKIKDSPVRWIYVDGSGNVRDMGGWKTASGKTVKYGMLYRGKNIDDATDLGVATLKNLGIKTEFDLRYSNQKFQKEGTGFDYIFLETSAQYDMILEDNCSNEVKANYKKIFEVLSNSSNYPIYTHCSAGADRTGTYAFILNGLLGVSYEDLTRDFELTSFSSAGKRWRGTGDGGTFASNDLIMQTDGNYVAWGKLYQEMMNSKYNTDGTLSNTIQNYLVNYVGVPKSQIDSFKSIMLG